MEGEGGFVARLESARVLGSLLGALGRGDARLELSADAEDLRLGLSAVSGAAHARCSLPASAFEEYRVQGETHLSLSLGSLLDCLQLFGTSEPAALTLSFSPDTALLTVCLEDAGILAACELPSMVEAARPSVAFAALSAQPEQCAFIARSDALREALQDALDMAGASRVRIDCDERGVLVSTEGALGRCCVSLPRESPALVSFALRAPVSCVYPLPAFAQAMRALSVSREACLRISEGGLLCQHQVEGAGGVAYVDFLLLPEEEDE